MRKGGFSLVEILVALGLGGLLLGLGISIASLWNRQASNANALAQAKEGLLGGVDILAKELRGRRVVGLEQGTPSSMTALLQSGETAAAPADYGANSLTLSLVPGAPLPPALQPGGRVFLARRGVSAFGTVSTLNASARTLTVSLPAACASAFRAQGTQDPLAVHALERLTMAYDPSARTLSVTRSGAAFRSEPLPVPLAFAYIYRGSAGERVLSSMAAVAGADTLGTLHLEGNSAFFLSAIVLGPAGQTETGSALAVIPVEPLGTGLCQASGGGGNAARGTLVVRIDDSDPFFNAAYNNAPANAKAFVSWAGNTTTLPAVGTHTLTVGPMNPSDAGAVETRLIPATETVAGRSLTYTFGSTPPQVAFLGSSLSPLTPLEVELRYSPLPGSLNLSVQNLPAGGTWSAACTAQGRYANPAPCQNLSGTEANRSLSLAPGVYTFTFNPAAVARTATVNGASVDYTERYPIASVTPNPVGVSSAQTATLTAAYRTTPNSGTLRVAVSGLPAGVNPSYRILNASGNQMAAGGIAPSQNFSLSPGGYRIQAQTVTWGGIFYDPVPPTGDAVVGVSSDSVASHTIAYAVRPATLQVNMTGLPQGQGSIRVSGPGGYSQNLTGSATLTLTAFGTYTITAQDVVYGGRTYRATVSPGSVSAASGGSYTVSVAYQPITVLHIRFQNSTGGACTNGTLRVVGPAGFGTRTYSTDSTQAVIPAGSYTASMSAQPSSSLYTCQGSVTPSSLTLAQGDTGTFTVNVSATDGALRITLQNYPLSSLGSGHITVRGPSGNAVPNPSLVGNTLTYTRLAPGTYTVTASTFTDPSSGFQYIPSPSTASPSVSAGNTTNLTITYTAQAPPNSAGLRLTVDCPSCSSWQKSNISPLVCLYIGSGLPSSIPNTHLTDCPQAVIR